MATSFNDPTYLEAVYAALLAQLQTATFAGNLQVQTWGRILVLPDQVAAQPGVFVLNTPLHVEQKEFALAKWNLVATVVVYFQSDPTVANYLLWGLMQSLLTKDFGSYQKQTLGGLVYHAWVEGPLYIETQDTQAVMTFPVLMLAGDVG